MYTCLLCDSNKEKFSSKEHIIPHSLGNDILVLPKGWVCDKCNNTCSAFESRAINHSHLGAERAMLGIVSKKGKPARSKYGKMHWNAEPNMKKNIISIDKKEFDKEPIFKDKVIITVHNKFNYDISKLLLKIGIELMCRSYYINNPNNENPNLLLKYKEAKEHVLNKNTKPWPYFLITSDKINKHIVSTFADTPDVHKYICDLGFDIFIQETNDNDIICIFLYGNFKHAINLTSQSPNWINEFRDLDISYVGCPIEFVEYSN